MALPSADLKCLILYLFLSCQKPAMPTNPVTTEDRPVLLNLMDAIIAQNQRETGDVIQVDSVRADAVKAVDCYLSLPVTRHHEGTYSFWRNHSMTTDKAQKGLCKLSRIYLTPPPTSTGRYRVTFHNATQ